MRRRVVFDGGVLAAPRWTGVALAFVHALRAYARLADTRPCLLLPRGAPDPCIEGVEIVPIGTYGPLRRAVLVPRLLQRLDAAVLHSPVVAMPRAMWSQANPRRIPVVVTAHDLPWMCEPRLVPRDDGDSWRARTALRYALRHAAVILCVSRATRADLLRWHGRRPSTRVRVVYNCVPAPTSPADLHDLTGPLLTIGNQRPRKNLALLRAACDRARRLDARVPELRVLGAPNPHLPEADKLALLRSSTALLHVASFEGFGMPIVEAFRHGVPVLCSDRGAMREVAGAAALLVDPQDLDACAGAILRICTDPELRDRLHTRGLARGADFSPVRTATAWRRIHSQVADA